MGKKRNNVYWGPRRSARLPDEDVNRYTEATLIVLPL